MTSKLGIAIIGLGMASLPHARALKALADVEVVHAFSPSAARRAAFADAHAMPVIDNAEAIFRDPRVDAVLLLTPPNTHLELVQQAAAAGKHVLLEKPLDISMARAEQLVTTAEQAGITLGVVLQNRFRPAALQLQELVDAGRLGQLVQVGARTSYWRPQSYYDEPGRGTLARDGGGVLLTQAIHNLDLMIALAGMPRTVSGFVSTSPVHDMEGEDVATAALRFDNGALGSISATTCAYPGLPDAIELIGDKGTALLSGSKLAVRLHDGTVIDCDGDEAGSGSGADPMGFSSQAHQLLIQDFADALAHGRKPRISGRDALKVHALIAAILASNGQPIQL